MISVEKAREQINVIRQQTSRPFGLNFFCHTPVEADPKKEAAWRERLAPYYRKAAELDPSAPVVAANRAPFDAAMCALVEEMKPPVVSFHFRPSAGRVAEARQGGGLRRAFLGDDREGGRMAGGAWRGCGHRAGRGGGRPSRGMFLTQDVAAQPGTLALVPQIVDAVRALPQIAAPGGIADGRGVAAAFMLGAAGVQIGTAYLACPESTIAQPFRDALAKADADSTATTNLMTGKPARGIFNRLMRELGPLSADVPDFPYAATAIGPLRADTEKKGSGEFTPLWSGQAAALARAIPAADMTRSIAADAMRLLGGR